MQKTLLILLFILSPLARGQSKTWGGTTTNMWPHQSTNAINISKSGTNTRVVLNGQASAAKLVFDSAIGTPSTNDLIMIRATDGSFHISPYSIGDLRKGSGSFPVMVSTVPDLIDLDVTVASAAITKGYWSIGDGGEGVYMLIGNQTSTNHGAKIASATPGYSWQLIYDEWVNVLQWGAKRDGATPSANLINEAFAWGGTQSPHKKLWVPPGDYSITNKLLLNYSDAYLRLNGRIRNANAVNDYSFWLGNALAGAQITNGISYPSTAHIIVDGEGIGTIDQNCQNSPSQDRSTSKHCILAYGIQGLTIRNLIVTNTVDWAMSIELCHEVEVSGCQVVTGQENNVTVSGSPHDFGGQDGIHFIDVDRGSIHHNNVISGDDALLVSSQRTINCGNVTITDNSATVRLIAYAADGVTPQTNNASGRFALVAYCAAITADCGLTNVIFANNTITGGSGLFAVYDDGTAHSGKPTSIKFIGNTWSGQSGEGATNATSSGIDQGWFIAGAENVTFENNIFHDIARWGRALWFSQYATNGLITFRGNTFRNFKLPYPRAFFPTESPSILWIHSGTRVVIEDNIFQDNEIAPISVGITFNTATNQLESMIVNRNTFINNNTTWSAGTGASTNRHAVMFAVGVNHIVFDNNRVVTNYGGMFLGRAIRRFHAHGNTILGLGNGSFTADADAFEFRGDEPMIGVEVNNNQINGIDGRFLSGSNMGNLVVLGNSLGSIQRSHSTDYQISYSVNSSSLTNEPFINFGGFVNGNISYLASTSNPIRLDSSIDASAYTGPKLRVVDSYNYHPVTVLTNSVTANATALFLSN